MRDAVAAVYAIVAAIAPIDETESIHRAEALTWLTNTDDVYRRVPPATPPRHLVSYVVPVDRTDGSVLLVDHIKAGLWLPPGGLVEPAEDPTVTAQREVQEELGLTDSVEKQPVFLTATATVGAGVPHTDVSLWFPLYIDRVRELTIDRREFRAARWWSRAEIGATDPGTFDPHLGRFLAKLGASGRPQHRH